MTDALTLNMTNRQMKSLVTGALNLMSMLWRLRGDA